jgi:hypothetical protein
VVLLGRKYVHLTGLMELLMDLKASVFLSHSSKDKPFVRELFRRLTRDGVTCFFDEESIE